jgi:hypothetical protein
VSAGFLADLFRQNLGFSVGIDRLAVAFRNVQGINIQLLMPESYGGPFDSDSDPESYDIHAGCG